MIQKLRNYKFELKDLKKESYDLEDVNKDMTKTFGEKKNKCIKDLILIVVFLSLMERFKVKIS